MSDTVCIATIIDEKCRQLFLRDPTWALINIHDRNKDVINTVEDKFACTLDMFLLLLWDVLRCLLGLLFGLGLLLGLRLLRLRWCTSC